MGVIPAPGAGVFLSNHPVISAQSMTLTSVLLTRRQHGNSRAIRPPFASMRTGSLGDLHGCHHPVLDLLHHLPFRLRVLHSRHQGPGMLHVRSPTTGGFSLRISGVHHLVGQMFSLACIMCSHGSLWSSSLAHPSSALSQHLFLYPCPLCH